jgi:hypothetical protein
MGLRLDEEEGLVSGCHRFAAKKIVNHHLIFLLIPWHASLIKNDKKAVISIRADYHLGRCKPFKYISSISQRHPRCLDMPPKAQLAWISGLYLEHFFDLIAQHWTLFGCSTKVRFVQLPEGYEAQIADRRKRDSAIKQGVAYV